MTPRSTQRALTEINSRPSIIKDEQIQWKSNPISSSKLVNCLHFKQGNFANMSLPIEGPDGILVPDMTRNLVQLPVPSRPWTWKWLRNSGQLVLHIFFLLITQKMNMIMKIMKTVTQGIIYSWHGNGKVRGCWRLDFSMIFEIRDMTSFLISGFICHQKGTDC